MRLPLLCGLIFCLPLLSLAQTSEPEIKIKSNKVYVNNKACLSVRSDINGTTFSDLSGKELIYLVYYSETTTNPSYTKIVFLQEKRIITNLNSFISRKILIKELIHNDVLVNCGINPEGIETFALKFHDEIPTFTKITMETRE